MTYDLLPDLDQALVTYLKLHPSLTPLHQGRCGTALQSPLTSLRIGAIGGAQPWPWQAVAQYQLEAWGGDQAQANTLIRTALAAVFDLRGPVADGYISGVSVVLGPVWTPDEQTGRPRYLAQISITAYPEGT